MRHLFFKKLVKWCNKFEEYELALQYALNANAIFYSIADSNLDDVKISNHKVGKAYAFLGKYEKQKEYYQKNIEIDLKNFPENHPELAHDYVIMGFAYHNLRNTEKKLRCLQNAYKILEKIYLKNFKQTFSYSVERCIFEWINLLQGLITTYEEMNDKVNVDLFVSKMEEKKLKRIISKYNFRLERIEDGGIHYTLTTM